MDALQCALGRAQWPGAQEEASTGNAFVGDGKPSGGHHGAGGHPDGRADARMTARPSCPSDTPGPADGQTGTDARRQGASSEHGRGRGSGVQHNFGGNAPRDAGSFHPEQDAGDSAVKSRNSHPSAMPGPSHDDQGTDVRHQCKPREEGQRSDPNGGHHSAGNGLTDAESSQLREGAASNPEMPQRHPSSGVHSEHAGNVGPSGTELMPRHQTSIGSHR